MKTSTRRSCLLTANEIRSSEPARAETKDPTLAAPSKTRPVHKREVRNINCRNFPRLKPLPARHKERGSCHAVCDLLPHLRRPSLSPDRTSVRVLAGRKHLPDEPASSKYAPPQWGNEYLRRGGCERNQ